MLFKIILIFGFLILGGCAQNSPKVDTKPKWINNPYLTHKTAAVGSAKTHYYGEAAQRKLAISRALDELASQQGVRVSSKVTRHDHRDGSRTSAKSDIYSFQTTDNKVVHAHIEDTWRDPRTDELFIWMIAE